MAVLLCSILPYFCYCYQALVWKVKDCIIWNTSHNKNSSLNLKEQERLGLVTRFTQNSHSGQRRTDTIMGIAQDCIGRCCISNKCQFECAPMTWVLPPLHSGITRSVSIMISSSSVSSSSYLQPNYKGMKALTCKTLGAVYVHTCKVHVHRIMHNFQDNA